MSGRKTVAGTRAVAAQIGTTYRQLDHWVTRGWLLPAHEGRQGAYREWPDIEVEVARLLVRLVDAGLTGQAAASYARTVVAFHLTEAEIGPGLTIVITAD